jgi:hypothetical protein
MSINKMRFWYRPLPVWLSRFASFSEEERWTSLRGAHCATKQPRAEEPLSTEIASRSLSSGGAQSRPGGSQ